MLETNNSFFLIKKKSVSWKQKLYVLKISFYKFGCVREIYQRINFERVLRHSKQLQFWIFAKCWNFTVHLHIYCNQFNEVAIITYGSVLPVKRLLPYFAELSYFYPLHDCLCSRYKLFHVTPKTDKEKRYLNSLRNHPDLDFWTPSLILVLPCAEDDLERWLWAKEIGFYIEFVDINRYILCSF